MSELILGTGVSFVKEPKTARNVISAALENGIYRFDTAPSYKTEGLLGEILQDELSRRNISREEVYIQTKIDAWQMQEGKIDTFLHEALGKLRVDYLDAFLIHWPISEYMEKTWEKMTDLKRNGLVKRIGICNVRVRQLREYLSLKPDIIQIERHPLNIFFDEVTFCHENDIEIQAYSPLCKMDDRIKKSEIINKIAEKYSKDQGQIVLRWHLDTGVIPIFTTSKAFRIEAYSRIDDFNLTDEEIDEINSMNENYKMYLESVSCPGF